MLKFSRLGLGQKDVAVAVGAERAASGVGVKYDLSVFGSSRPPRDAKLARSSRRCTAPSLVRYCSAVDRAMRFFRSDLPA
jgi:hypothetical protein